jgi:glutamine amidotransferase
VSVAIIDYGSGNLHSAAKAFERAARGMENPEKIVVTRDPEVVFRADRIVLPGVGAFADCPPTASTGSPATSKKYRRARRI